jgi:hypothetical protein
MPVSEILQDFIVDMQNAEKINQLTVKGLSLLLALFAEKEASENQPIIAGSIDSLMRLAALIDNSAPGTELSVIFTPEVDTEETWTAALGKKTYARAFSWFHKTTFILRKNTIEKMEVIHIDGIATNCDYFDIPNKLILKALSSNAKKHDRATTQMISYEPNYPDNLQVEPERKFNGSRYVNVIPKLQRQENTYICGVYAIKDARLFTRSFTPNLTGDVYFADTEFGKYQYQNYIVPPSILRSSQSEETLQYLTANANNLQAIVNRKQSTLVAFFDKYKQAGSYINKFANKYLDKIAQYVETAAPEKIEMMSSLFNATDFTQADIERINAARNSSKNKLLML